MSDPSVRAPSAPAAHTADLIRRPIGRHLCDAGVLSARQLVSALGLQARQQALLGEILVAERMASREDLLQAVAAQHGLHVVDLDEDPPDPALSRLMPPEFWLKHKVLPWMAMGDTLVLATARPDLVQRIAPDLPQPDARILAVVASEAQILEKIATAHGADMAERAEARVAAAFSSRRSETSGNPLRGRAVAAVFLAMIVMPCVLWPDKVWTWVTTLAALTLIPVAGLKITAFLVQLVARQHDVPRLPPPQDVRLPKISILVPLYRETEIARTLVRRLERLRYPRALLQVLLVLEAHDDVTRQALQSADLPDWIRICEVPSGGTVTTKPRAMNYALDFADGDIIGVWDAEDAPDPGQLEEVAARFATAPPEVVCLQGILDYYNPRASWLTRCFTIEYAGWWRILLPGIARLGLILPLGGTTLFFRRHALEQLGAWDAHNVTEDADLGVRLARCGYRTELIGTVTHEEATCRIWPWVRQRSRWLKGFAMTWMVHMRSPSRLIGEIGWWRFAGLQVLLAGTVLQFAVAPVLWSFWLLLLTGVYPAAVAGSATTAWMGAVFVMAEVANMAIGAAGVARPGRRFLLPWVITMPLYYALGTLAAAKAIWELLWCPHFWDKTAHGRSSPDPDSADLTT